MIHMSTNSAHPKNAQDDHSQMLTGTELMILSRWVLELDENQLTSLPPEIGQLNSCEFGYQNT